MLSQLMSPARMGSKLVLSANCNQVKVLACAHHCISIVSLAVAIVERVEARIEGLIETPISTDAPHVILQAIMSIGVLYSASSEQKDLDN